MDGKLIVFSAPSGTGKTTIVRRLLATDLPLAFSVSATSRSKRTNEKEGNDYYFFSPEEFKKKIAQGLFLEWEEVYKDQFYGTLLSEIERIWAEGKHVVFDVDVVGGLNIKKKFPDKALAVFIMPPSIQELEKRLRSRGTECELSLAKRLEKAEYELTFANQFDTIIHNIELDVATEQAHRLVKNFLCK